MEYFQEVSERKLPLFRSLVERKDNSKFKLNYVLNSKDRHSHTQNFIIEDNDSAFRYPEYMHEISVLHSPRRLELGTSREKNRLANPRALTVVGLLNQLYLFHPIAAVVDGPKLPYLKR
jgi:hypothetical protein